MAAAAAAAFDGVDLAVSSDLRRARHTAVLLATGRAWPPVRTFRGLRERGAGQWTGLTRPAIEEGWPGALEQPVAAIPGGESPAAVTARAVATLHRIAEAWPGATVVAVTHGALIRLVEQHAGGAPIPVANLAGRWVGVDHGRIRLGDPDGPAAGPVMRHAVRADAPGALDGV
jgi:probable phosphoglycerate mutase